MTMANVLDLNERQEDIQKIKDVARTSSAKLTDEQAADIWINISTAEGQDWLPVPQSAWEIWSYICVHVGAILKAHQGQSENAA